MIKKPIFFGGKALNEIFYRDEIVAIQKLSHGKANEYEQKFAYKKIAEKLCRVADNSFNPDSNTMSFNEGVRFVGTMLAQAIDCDIDKFPERKIINNKQ
jgi:hypothetical protein